VLYSPKCQHLTEVSQLDSINVHGIYEIDTDEKIKSINSDATVGDVHMPKCVCGATLESIHRYKVQAKLVTFQNTLDLLLAKMGRKIAGFGESIEIQDKTLKESFESFLEGIRPNPLASQANLTALLQRSRKILDFQKQIVSFRDDVVHPFERSIATLHQGLPNIVPLYRLLFHVHFEVLEYRIVSIRLDDYYKLGTRLLTLPDPSYGVQRQGLKMLEFVHKESTVYVGLCETALNNQVTTSSPATEIEIRLLQLRFLALAKYIQFRLADLGRQLKTQPAERVNNNVTASLNVITKLIARSLGSCASFTKTVREFITLFSSNQFLTLQPVPTIKNAHVRQVEKLWGQHKLGHLKLCGKRHVYSRETFSDTCPECEKHAQLSRDDLFRQSANHLFEQDFLACMRGEAPKASGTARTRIPSSSIIGSSKSRTASNKSLATTTPEEPSLAAMHKDSKETERETTPPKADNGTITPEKLFLAALHKNSRAPESKTKSSKAEVAPTTPEELFLAAMRKKLEAVENGATSPKTEVHPAVTAKEETDLVRSENPLTMEEKFLLAMKRMENLKTNGM
jgi:hypothetical protein